MNQVRQETHYDGRQVACYSPRPNSTYSLLEAAALAFPRKTVFIDDHRSVTYADFEADVTRIAANLARTGIARGDRVGTGSRQSDRIPGNRFRLRPAWRHCRADQHPPTA